jgi:hypothetical protein
MGSDSVILCTGSNSIVRLPLANTLIHVSACDWLVLVVMVKGTMLTQPYIYIYIYAVTKGYYSLL